jgi:hypothetical protein
LYFDKEGYKKNRPECLELVKVGGIKRSFEVKWEEEEGSGEKGSLTGISSLAEAPRQEDTTKIEYGTI